MTRRNGLLLRVAVSALRHGSGGGSSSAGLSRVTRKTTHGGIIATSPSPMPRIANSVRLSAIVQPRTVARMIAPSVPAMENTIRYPLSDERSS